MTKHGSRGATLTWALVAILAVLHHDFWWWNDRTLVLGFLPISLFYHALFSVAASCLWALALKIAWPRDLEEWASGGPEAQEITKKE